MKKFYYLYNGRSSLNLALANAGLKKKDEILWNDLKPTGEKSKSIVVYKSFLVTSTENIGCQLSQGISGMGIRHPFGFCQS